MFDYNNSPQGEAGFKVDGDLPIEKGSYPLLSEVLLEG